ncbi:FAS1-like dehydratase domain-containing protein [Halopenitus persicus]|uniref:FAS1-like dehydratase domain-containing protein n=1 Tax=Halopenitus persicus TaxID=1048396 RepID=UPI000BBABBEB|nr:MaoC family dehydratase N-terminal domain-containing protein [Halopenitus persicus]
MPNKPLSDLKAQIGDSYKTVKNLRIEPGKVSEFASAIQDDNPIFHSREAANKNGYENIPAPLTFTRTSYFPRYRPEGIDEDLGFDLDLNYDNVLHGEQEYEYERPVVVGDTLTGTTTLVDVYQKEGVRAGTMTFCIYETEYYDEDDKLVVTERISRIEIEDGDAK